MESKALHQITIEEGPPNRLLERPAHKPMNPYWRAKEYLRLKQVKLTSCGPIGLIFEVGPTPQTVIKRWNGVWSCSCPHFAIHTDERCSHLKAAKAWLKGEDLEDEEHEQKTTT